MARILVVDDEDAIREILARRLHQWGHDVVQAGSALAALEQMELAPAEVVFCDVIMPVHDGTWLLKELLARWPATVVVVVSGAQEMSTVMTMRRLGAVDCVTKPIGREMLHQALDRAIAAADSRRET